MRATNHRRPYQGYPYVEPPVHDIPTIDEATASRWANLPRRQLTLPVGRTAPAGYQGGTEARNDAALPEKDEPDPVVYIDMPESEGSCVSEQRTPDQPAPSTYRDKNKRDPDDPVVYIDLPDDNGSVTHTSQAPSLRDEEPEFVQDTIFFDPFENRRIEMNKEDRESESEDDTVSTVSGQSNWRPHTRPLPAIRPTHLDLYGAGSSGVGSSSPSTVPSMLSKETLIYGQSNDDGFPMSPIPVSEFPEPPPAYAEIDQVSSPVVDVEPVTEVRDEQPRTQVILPRDYQVPTVGTPNTDRKNLNCHHCGLRVHTLVVRENGTITHASAMLFLLVCLIPVVAFIYCTDYMKIKNHYCPNCNKIIGYELPFRANKIVYVN